MPTVFRVPSAPTVEVSEPRLDGAKAIWITPGEHLALPQSVVPSSETSGRWMPSNTTSTGKSEDKFNGAGGKELVSTKTTLPSQPSTHLFDQKAQPNFIHDRDIQTEFITGPLPFPDFTFSPAGLAFMPCHKDGLTRCRIRRASPATHITAQSSTSSRTLIRILPGTRYRAGSIPR
ncbi:hypothetical protein BKA70DRAFT_1343029 [Coprinopsis sp. MPI-PUGE-AT-0042]|nr:hypothetical protein BKA70DRAFT_1343029 [Coprinopsis sp. MPI-PUGE-AT-0042]